MRVTVVLQDLHDTGAARVSMDRAARWSADGDDVTVFVVSHEDLTAGPVLIAPESITLVRATAHPQQLRRVLPTALLRLVRLCRASDVVVAGTEVGYGLLLSWCAGRLAGKPIAVTVQSDVERAVQEYVDSYLQRFTRFVLDHVDLAVCVSLALAHSVSLGATTAAESRQVIAVLNAVDAPSVRDAASHAPSEVWNEALPLVVASGRLARQKGFDLLLRADAISRELGAQDHVLMILGEGSERAALLQLAGELGVARTTLMPGFSTNPHAVVARASMFVLSSRWEGCPLVLAEALAVGTACAAFDCPTGPAEVLAGGAFGALLATGDVEGLARVLMRHLADPGELQARARSWTNAPPARHTPAAAAREHRRALQALVDRRVRAGRRPRSWRASDGKA